MNGVVVMVRFGLFICMAMLCLKAYAQIEVTDDMGNRIVLDGHANRIISLAPHITEILFAAGAGERLVGTVEYSDYPAEALGIPRVGDSRLLDLEAIVALQPDLVVSWHSGNPEVQIGKVRSLGLPVYITEPRNLADIASNIRRLGAIAGTGQVADTVARDFAESYSKVQKDNAGKRRVRVFYQIWNQPLITVNGRHLISDVIRACGGENVFTNTSALAPAVSEESVIKLDPEVIVASGADSSRPVWLDDWRKWTHLKAVRGDHLYSIPPDFLHRHTPRILKGMQMMCDYLDRVRGLQEKAPAGSD